MGLVRDYAGCFQSREDGRHAGIRGLDVERHIETAAHIDAGEGFHHLAALGKVNTDGAVPIHSRSLDGV